MKIKFSNIKISAMTTALPKETLNLNQLADRFGEKEVRRIIANTGIHSVHIAPSEMTLSQLCLSAAQHLIDTENINKNTIDAIVLVTQTPDKQLPATSVIIQNQLGLSKNTVAFDINYGCSGYIYGLYQAAMLIASGGCERVLVCAGDLMRRFINPNEQHVAMLFGDAVSATLIEKGSGEFSFVIKTDGAGAEYLTIKNNFLHMDGAKVMEFALREVPPVIDELLLMNNWNKEQVGTFALHQANQFMVRYLQKVMRLDAKAVPVAVENSGNTGPATIPLLLSLKHNELKSENRLEKTVLCGFGVGLSWGAVSHDFSKTAILPPLYV